MIYLCVSCGGLAVPFLMLESEIKRGLSFRSDCVLAEHDLGPKENWTIIPFHSKRIPHLSAFNHNHSKQPNHPNPTHPPKTQSIIHQPPSYSDLTSTLLLSTTQPVSPKQPHQPPTKLTKSNTILQLLRLPTLRLRIIPRSILSLDAYIPQEPFISSNHQVTHGLDNHASFAQTHTVNSDGIVRSVTFPGTMRRKGRFGHDGLIHALWWELITSTVSR